MNVKLHNLQSQDIIMTTRVEHVARVGKMGNLIIQKLVVHYYDVKKTVLRGLCWQLVRPKKFA